MVIHIKPLSYRGVVLLAEVRGSAGQATRRGGGLARGLLAIPVILAGVRAVFA